MERRRDTYEAFLEEDFDAYVSAMSGPGTWGDELTLRAIADSYGVVLNLVTSSSSHWFQRYEPKKLKLKKELWATYISPVHYNVLRRQHNPNRQASIMLPAPA